MPEQPASQVVELRDFSLSVGARSLLERVSVRCEPGEIVLIVGPSGAGKSLLLRALAGLPAAGEVTATGEASIGGVNVLKEPRRSPAGMVFQNFALFDELSALDNVRFAAAHRLKKEGAKSPPKPEELLAELDVPRNVRTASLSGGQRQRLAIARALAYDPTVMLYDEPTSGLDAAAADQVAAIIARTHESHPQTSVIVTHDYESLTRIADRVLLFDQRGRTLREIPRSDWPRLHALLREVRIETDEPPNDASRANFVARFAVAAAAFLAGTSRVVEQALLLPWSLLPRWRSPTWGLSAAGRCLRLVADPSAWLYMLATGAIAGFVATYFTFRFLPFRQYMEPLLIENLLHALGFALYRILVPVLATVLVAARCGAAVASDLGGKSYGQQLDALRSFGALPERYLRTGALYAFLLGTPLLTWLAFVAAKWTSVLVFTATHPELGAYFWESHFFRELIESGQWLYRGSGWLVAKTLCCAAGMALIAYDRGARPKHSTADVSAGVTSTILWSTLWVLVVHFAFAFYEF